LNLHLIIRLKFTGNQNLFEQDNSFQFRKSRAEGYVIPVQIKKDAFQYHNVVKYVKGRLRIIENNSIIYPLFFCNSKTAKIQFQLARRTNLSRYNANRLR